MGDRCSTIGADTPIPTHSDVVPTNNPPGEILDDPSADPAMVRRMLRDIARSNRWFGGRHAVRWGLEHLFDREDRGGHFVICDIGTGGGDLPRDAARWARGRGMTFATIGLERIPAAAALARSTGMPMVLGCASALPFAGRSVDVVMVSQVAHHLSRSEAAALFAACSRIARRGVVIADLRPSHAYALAFKVGSRLLRMHPATRIDGITSIARGFTTDALRELVAESGHAAHVAALPFARVSAAWRTNR